MAVLAHVFGANSTLGGRWSTTRHAAVTAIHCMSSKVPVLNFSVAFTPSELDHALLVHHKVKFTTVSEAIRMLALVGRPHFCVTRHTVSASATMWSLNDGVLMLERDVILVFQTPEASSHSQDIDAM
eukprot:4787894-Amphidinium_carterae.1